METQEEATESRPRSGRSRQITRGGAAAAGGTGYRGRPFSFYTDKLKNGKAWERIQAASGLGSFGADATSAVPELTEFLSGSDENLRQPSAWSIGQIGAASGVAGVNALRKALNDINGKVRCLAAIGLEASEQKRLPPSPTLFTPSTIPRILCVPVHRLSERRSRSPASALAAKVMAKGEDGFVLLNAGYALGNIGPGARNAIPALEHALAARRAEAAAKAAILKIQGKPVATYHD